MEGTSLIEGRKATKSTPSGKQDVLRWILSFGDQAKIIDPPELIEGVNKANSDNRTCLPNSIE